MQDNNFSLIQRYAQKIGQIITQHNYKRVVLQISKSFLPISFMLTNTLSQKHSQCKFYALYDSLKQSCCTDLLGAEHVAYDCLIHFGNACFSSQYKENQHFIFQQFDEVAVNSFAEIFQNGYILKQLQQKQIKYLMVCQKYYEILRQKVFSNEKFGESNIQVLRLPMDAKNDDKYLVFGYWTQLKYTQGNILIIQHNRSNSQIEDMDLSMRVSFVAKSLPIKINQIYCVNLQSKNLQPFNANHNKRIMQRYSMISQLPEHKVFGIIVSNTATNFHQAVLLRCLDVLKRHGKKAFTFMMNNLNEVKLGNFPQIQVYVVISCFNHSMFSIKDFHRLVVNPNDLQVAFQGRAFDHYEYDCQSESKTKIAKIIKEQKNEEQNLQLDKVQTQIVLSNKIQTLDFYREREFKGLQFAQKKQVKKASKGKIGLAQQYKNLQ